MKTRNILKLQYRTGYISNVFGTRSYTLTTCCFDYIAQFTVVLCKCHDKIYTEERDNLIEQLRKTNVIVDRPNRRSFINYKMLSTLRDTVLLPIRKFYVQENRSLLINTTQVFNTFYTFNDKIFMIFINNY